MISSPFEYSRATSLDDALAKLKASNGDGKFIAGGHSLVPLMKLRLSEPKALIDIARIPGLSGIREKDGKIEIGAGTVHHDVASSALLQKVCPALAECAGAIGDPQVRNRGTLGGSLAARGSGGRLSGGDAGARRRDSSEGSEGLAGREGRGLFPGAVHRRSGAG